MTIRFQKSDNGIPPRFQEKHVRTIGSDVTVQSLIDLEAKAKFSRNFAADKKADVNTLLCMTLEQQQTLFAWLEKNKATEMGKVKKDEMSEVSGIPINGVIVFKGEAWGGGTFTLGFQKATGTVVEVVHLGKWDWTGTFKFAVTKVVSAKEAGQYAA
jgi:hypothetical protein